jgi:hypothetical protein
MHRIPARPVALERRAEPVRQDRGLQVLRASLRVCRHTRNDKTKSLFHVDATTAEAAEHGCTRYNSLAQTPDFTNGQTLAIHPNMSLPIRYLFILHDADEKPTLLRTRLNIFEVALSSTNEP